MSKIVRSKPNRKNMVFCRTCKYEIAINAKTCPSCGEESPLPLKPLLKRTAKYLIITIIGAFIAFQASQYILGNTIKDLPILNNKR